MSRPTDPSTGNARKPLVSVADLPTDTLPTVTIPSEELQAVEIAGAERATDHKGTISKHQLGARGEYAMAKYLGVEERFDTCSYDVGDGGVDLRMSGANIQVKTASLRQNNPNFLVPTYQELNSDYYTLVHEISRSVYRILGYTDRSTVAQAPIFKGELLPDAYFATQDLLEPLPTPPISTSFV